MTGDQLFLFLFLYFPQTFTSIFCVPLKDSILLLPYNPCEKFGYLFTTTPSLTPRLHMNIPVTATQVL